MKNIIIIGGGIASYALIPKLSYRENKIFLVDGDEYYPSCSENSTAINCLRGIKKGISPLGDLLYDSHHEFLKFYQAYRPNGVYKGIEQIFFNQDDLQLIKRYPEHQKVDEKCLVKNKDYYVQLEAYFWNFQLFKTWVKENFDFELLQDYVKTINNNELSLHKNGVVNFDHVYCCTNNTNNYYAKFNHDYEIYRSKLKSVKGSFLETNYNCEFSSSTSIKVDGVHYIFRKEDKILQIGSTSEQSDHFIHSKTELDSMYENTKQRLNISIPKRESFNYKTGIRQKGAKRLPFWGPVAPNIDIVNGLYKNGFSFAFMAAKELTKCRNSSS